MILISSGKATGIEGARSISLLLFHCVRYATCPETASGFRTSNWKSNEARVSVLFYEKRFNIFMCALEHFVPKRLATIPSWSADPNNGVTGYRGCRAALLLFLLRERDSS